MSLVEDPAEPQSNDGPNRRWLYTERGRLSRTIRLEHAPIPEPGDGQMVVKVRAAALNPVENQVAQSPDWLLRLIGAPPMGTPFVPCWDFAGKVHALGRGVTGYAIGDEVFGMAPNMGGKGSLQQYMALAASAPFTHKPASLSFTDAAALPLVYATVYTALIIHGRLPFDPVPAPAPSATATATAEASAVDNCPRAHAHARRSVLVLGGSSGTGSVAIQLAKKMGLDVVVSCSAANEAFVRELGADEVIDYHTEHVPTRALHSQYAPYAVVLDCVGGTELLPHLTHLILDDPAAPELGIYVTIVGDKTSRDAMGGATTNYFYPSQVLRNLRGALGDYIPRWLPGRTWLASPRYVCMSLQPSKEIMDTVEAFVRSVGNVRVDSTYRFEDAPRAFERLESARARGKVVVEIA